MPSATTSVPSANRGTLTLPSRRPHCPACGLLVPAEAVARRLQELATVDEPTRDEVYLTCERCRAHLSVAVVARVDIVVNVDIESYEVDEPLHRQWLISSCREGIKVNGVLFPREYPLADVEAFRERANRIGWDKVTVYVGSDDARMLNEDDAGPLCERCRHGLMEHYDGEKAGHGGCEYGDDAGDGGCRCRLTRLEVLAQHTPVAVASTVRPERSLEAFE